jgi:hypothetical protein
MQGHLLSLPQPALLRCCCSLAAGLYNGCTAVGEMAMLLLRPWSNPTVRSVLLGCTAAAAAGMEPRATAGASRCKLLGWLTGLLLASAAARVTAAALLSPTLCAARGAAAAALCVCCRASFDFAAMSSFTAIAAAALGAAVVFWASSFAASAGGSAAAAGMRPMLAVSQMAASRTHSDCLRHSAPKHNMSTSFALPVTAHRVPVRPMCWLPALADDWVLPCCTRPQSHSDECHRHTLATQQAFLQCLDYRCKLAYWTFSQSSCCTGHLPRCRLT